jgi:hypothetical protein
MPKGLLAPGTGSLIRIYIQIKGESNPYNAYKFIKRWCVDSNYQPPSYDSIRVLFLLARRLQLLEPSTRGTRPGQVTQRGPGGIVLAARRGSPPFLGPRILYRFYQLTALGNGPESDHLWHDLKTAWEALPASRSLPGNKPRYQATFRLTQDYPAYVFDVPQLERYILENEL